MYSLTKCTGSFIFDLIVTEAAECQRTRWEVVQQTSSLLCKVYFVSVPHTVRHCESVCQLVKVKYRCQFMGVPKFVTQFDKYHRIKSRSNTVVQSYTRKCFNWTLHFICYCVYFCWRTPWATLYCYKYAIPLTMPTTNGSRDSLVKERGQGQWLPIYIHLIYYPQLGHFVSTTVFLL